MTFNQLSLFNKVKINIIENLKIGGKIKFQIK
jgi:hypothetical protein